MPDGCHDPSMIPDAEDINSRADLVNLIEALRTDLLQNPEVWESLTLNDYLEAMAALMIDTDKSPWQPRQPELTSESWRFFAQILLGARIYE